MTRNVTIHGRPYHPCDIAEIIESAIGGTVTVYDYRHKNNKCLFVVSGRDIILTATADRLWLGQKVVPLDGIRDAVYG